MERLARILLGTVLLVLTLTPVFRLLDNPETGGPGREALAIAESNLATTWLGMVLVAGCGLVLAILVPRIHLDTALNRLSRAVSSPGPRAWTAFVSVLATGLALAGALFVFRGHPTLADEMTSLLHARFLAEGRLSGAYPDPAAAWMVPNGILTDAGWVSQYPPLHLLLLALGVRVGAPWLVGPILTGILAGCTALVAHRLLGDRAPTARMGSVLVAVSPFVVLLGGGYLSHVSAAAFAALTLWTALEARDGAWGWSVAAGVSMGLLVTSRPWTGLVLGSAFTLGVWGAAAWKDQGARLGHLPTRLAGAVLGGLPVAVAWGAYNRHFFGRPLRLGYSAAFGESHALGFHVEPWGNLYGPLEALGYTSTDLLALGFHLLETPLSIVPAVAAYLVLARALPRGAGILVAWATLPLAANFFYWHHGAHLGPRMLYEAAPAWILLATLGMAELRGTPTPDPVTAVGAPRRLPGLSSIVLWSVVASFPAAAYLASLRAASYRWEPDTLQRVTAPEPEGPGRALVFVHGSWKERIAARLQAGGMRLDSLETALRRNDTCTIQRWVSVRLGRDTPEGGPPPAPDFRPLPGYPAHLAAVEISPGNRIQVDRTDPWTPECEREARADRGGVISLAPLIWQGDLPGAEHGRPVFVRDLGPAENRAVMARYPERIPYMYLSLDPEGAPELVPYARAETLVWGEGPRP